jgi:hypothetical protein
VAAAQSARLQRSTCGGRSGEQQAELVRRRRRTASAEQAARVVHPVARTRCALLAGGVRARSGAGRRSGGGGGAAYLLRQGEQLTGNRSHLGERVVDAVHLTLVAETCIDHAPPMTTAPARADTRHGETHARHAGTPANKE